MTLQLTPEQSKLFVKYMYKLTNPIKPHEAQIIGRILQTDHHQNDWRFKSHVFCGGCRRELSPLDMFLAGLNHHSPKYFYDYLYNGADGGGEVVYEDGKHPRIQVFRHGLDIPCVACGVVAKSEDPKACGIYLYKRPPVNNPTISMSIYWYDQLLQLANEEIAKQQHKDHKD